LNNIGANGKNEPLNVVKLFICNQTRPTRNPVRSGLRPGPHTGFQQECGPKNISGGLSLTPFLRVEKSGKSHRESFDALV
jgi:hypothetical protein